MKNIHRNWLFLLIFAIPVSATSKIILEKSELRQGTLFTKGTELTLDEKDYIFKAILGEDQKIMTERFSADMQYIFPAGTELSFKEPIDVWGQPSKNQDIPILIRISKKMIIHGAEFPPFTEFMIFGGSSTGPTGTKTFAELNLLYISNPLTIRNYKIDSGSIQMEIKKDGIIRIQTKSGWKNL